MYVQPLQLRKKMVPTRLIQGLLQPSAQVPKRSFGGGLLRGGLSKEAMEALGRVFRFEYMGFAEFELGAVEYALQFLEEQADAENLTSGVYLDVYYICPKAYEKGVRICIENLLLDEERMNLLAVAHVDVAVYNVANRLHQPLAQPVGWLELDNGFFLTTDDGMIEKMLALFGLE